MDADYADDQVLLANTPAQTECQMHSLEQAARCISFYINSDKTEYKCFKHLHMKWQASEISRPFHILC